MSYFALFLTVNTIFLIILIVLLATSDNHGVMVKDAVRWMKIGLAIYLIPLIVVGFMIRVLPTERIITTEVFPMSDLEEIEKNAINEIQHELCTDCNNHVLIEVERQKFLFFYQDYKTITVYLKDE